MKLSRGQFLRSLGLALSSPAAIVKDPAKQNVAVPKFTDIPGWKKLFEKVANPHGGQIFYKEGIAATLGWNRHLTVWDIPTFTTTGCQTASKEEWPEAWAAWRDYQIKFPEIETFDSWDDETRDVLFGHYGEARVREAKEVYDRWNALYAEMHDFNRKVVEKKLSIRAGARGFESVIVDQHSMLGEDSFYKRAEKWSPPFRAFSVLTPDELALANEDAREYRQRVLNWEVPPEIREKIARIRELAKERDEIEKKVYRMREDWRRKRDGILPRKSKNQKTPEQIAKRDATSRKRLKKSYEKFVRPTGKELILTPEWELGPSGPGQFVRVIRERYV